MEERLQQKNYEDGSYVDMRIKSLVIWSYIDGTGEKVSPAAQKYVLANPPTSREVEYLQAAMQDPSIHPNQKAQYAIERAL